MNRSTLSSSRGTAHRFEVATHALSVDCRREVVTGSNRREFGDVRPERPTSNELKGEEATEVVLVVSLESTAREELSDREVRRALNLRQQLLESLRREERLYCSSSSSS